MERHYLSSLGSPRIGGLAKLHEYEVHLIDGYVWSFYASVLFHQDSTR